MSKFQRNQRRNPRIPKIMRDLTDNILCRRAKYAKTNFNEKLITRLKTHPDFVDESGELLPTAVKNHAWQLNHNLINRMTKPHPHRKLPLSHPRLSSKLPIFHSNFRLTNSGIYGIITLYLFQISYP